MRFHRRAEAVLTLGRAVVAFGVSEEDSLPERCMRLNQSLRRRLSRLDYRWPQLDVVAAFQPRMEEIATGNLLRAASATGPASAVSSTRDERDPKIARVTMPRLPTPPNRDTYSRTGPRQMTWAPCYLAARFGPAVNVQHVRVTLGRVHPIVSADVPAAAYHFSPRQLQTRRQEGSRPPNERVMHSVSLRTKTHSVVRFQNRYTVLPTQPRSDADRRSEHFDDDLHVTGSVAESTGQSEPIINRSAPEDAPNATSRWSSGRMRFGDEPERQHFGSEAISQFQHEHSAADPPVSSRSFSRRSRCRQF